MTQQQPQERELMPGVYVTDFRDLTQRGSNSHRAGLGQLPDDVDINSITSASHSGSLSKSERTSLELEIGELENSIHHLQRSNSEMQNYLVEGIDDSDHVLMDSIEENERLIQRKTQQVELFRKLLQQVDALDRQVNPPPFRQTSTSSEQKKDNTSEQKTND